MIKIHPFTWLFALLAFMTAQFESFFYLLLLVSLHETAHAGMAACLGVKVEKMVLLPFGGRLELKHAEDLPLHTELLIALAGPFFHFLACGCLLAFFREMPFFELMWQLNLQVLLLNCLPIWPLDGGKVVAILFAFPSTIRQQLFLELFVSSFSVILLLLAGAATGTFHAQHGLIILYCAGQYYERWRWRKVQLERIAFRRSHAQPHPIVIHCEITDDISALRVKHLLKKGISLIFIIKKGGKVKAVCPEKSLLTAIYKQK